MEGTSEGVVEILTKPIDGHFDYPQGHAARFLLLSLTDQIPSLETEEGSADYAVAMCLMGRCYLRPYNMSQDVWIQVVLVATILTAGWISSPERAELFS